MEPIYRLRYKLGDVEFEIESSDLNWLEAKEKEYLAKADVTIPKISTKTKSPNEHFMPQRGMSINEFYVKYVRKIKSRPQTAILLIHYLQNYEKQQSGVTTTDVRDAFGRISYPNFNKLNYADILAGMKRRGMLNLVNKLWTLTITGKEFVLNSINAEVE